MELPTYTSIWKIEKRLYKLYDFRLPMPVPLGRVTAFLAIAAPYVLILAVAGVPLSHSLAWLYVLPPGGMTWLVTRPVLEGKRLPELAASQLRYLAEPRTWCRLAPAARPGQVLVTARVWRDLARAGAAAALSAGGMTAGQKTRGEVRTGAESAGGVRTGTGGAGGLNTVAAQPAGAAVSRPATAWPATASTVAPRAGGDRIVVVGTSGGAGQTVITLLMAQLLAALTGEPVAVIDFSARPGQPAPAAELARRLPDQLPAAAGDRLHLLTPGPGAPDPRQVIEDAAGRYPVTVADPAASDVSRAVRAAGQLVLVAPAGAAAAPSLARTLDWLAGHGHARLAATAVVALNGVIPSATRHAERAASVASSRCRGVVAVPWDGALVAGGAGGMLSPAAVQAASDLAGLLVRGLAGPAAPSPAPEMTAAGRECA